MKIGTRSLLFGVHQFLWHPWTVAKAWRFLYGRWPNRWEWLAVVVHDWGYWGRDDMDGAAGRLHPARSQSAAVWAAQKLGCSGLNITSIAFMVRHHSREMVKLDNRFSVRLNGKTMFQPSALCWPDKFSVLFDPEWFYLLRGRLSGEIAEFKSAAIESGKIPPSSTDRDWLRWYKSQIRELPEIRRILYHNFYLVSFDGPSKIAFT